MRSIAILTGLLVAAVTLGAPIDKPQPGTKAQPLAPKAPTAPTTKAPLPATPKAPSQPTTKAPTQPTQPVTATPTQTPGGTTTVSTVSADEQSIRDVVASFAKAYNAGDAESLAQLFLPEAEIVDPAGNIARGRENIRSIFATTFKQHPKGQIEVAIHSIRIVSPMVAIEDGGTSVLHEPQATPQRSRYTVVHVKQDGKWSMASARDLAEEEPTGDEQLHQLAWMIGDWVDEGSSSLVATSYRWSENKKYILSDFTVHFSGQPAMTGTQRIGWDPLAKKLRTWIFDSEGGQAEGVWSRQGKDWVVKLSGAAGDGRPSFATNILTPISKDRCQWQSRGRVKGGEPQPDIDTITVVRKPPAPKSAKREITGK